MDKRKEILYHVEKLLKDKHRYMYSVISPVDFSCFVTEERLSCENIEGIRFEAIGPGDRWGGDWMYGWLRSSVAAPLEAEGKRLVIRADFGSEATVYVNGIVRGALDLQHHDVTLTRSAKHGERFEIVAEAYAGHSGRQPVFGESHLCLFEEEVYQFYIDLECLVQVRNHIDADSLRAAEIDRCLTEVVRTIDWGLAKDALTANVQQCRQRMAPLLACVNGSTAPLLYLMGQSHLDIAWLWPMEETKRKIARTMSNQLTLMEEYPDYRYVQSQPYLFQLAKDLYPELYARIKRAVAEGRIIPEGGMWVESDTNLPGGESLIRQMLHGKRFFKEEFGKENEMLWLPDVFGYSGNMPQIMKGCGLRYFASVKMFQTYENVSDPFPYNTFLWEGIDGSQVLTHLLDYGDFPIRVNPSFLIRQWNERVQKDGIATRLVQFGHGDGGGGANRDDLEFLRRLENLEGVPRTTHGSPIDYFEDQIERGIPDAKYVGELYYPAHRGTYTTQAQLKRLNRKAEIGLRDAEMWGAAASLLQHRTYPYGEMDRLWKKLLLHQFHDILPGTSIHRVHEEAQAELTELNGLVDTMASGAREALADGERTGITAFNSLSWARKELVALPEGALGIADRDGKPRPVQWHDGISFTEVETPSTGWATYTVTAAESAPVAPGRAVITATKSRLENEYLTIGINECGEIVSIVDKETGTEWTAGNCNAMKMYRDQPSAFDAWEIDRDYQASAVTLGEKAEVYVTAQGPLFANIRVERALHHSKMIQDIRIRAGSRRIEFHTTVHWNEKNKMLRVDFPVRIHAKESMQEIQFGYVKRPNHASRPHDADRFEVCQHKWAVLAEANRSFALLNDCKYGIAVQDNTMSLTLLRSPTYPDERSDQGTHQFTYGFFVWNGAFLDSPVVQEAYELNYPVSIVQSGSRLGHTSLLQADRANVIAETIKLAEDGSGDWVIRAYESKGATVSCGLALGLPVKKAYETNMLEEVTSDLPVAEWKLKLEFRPFEVKTIRLVLHDE
ncbi:glycoside hydrolase family 38 C-terminal domain-containing protein [Paenibacillus sp. XY044]|uniref:alpha-mannosidase n=1 Tax=Paenibacillus sp. XY044 TaxID=2026089 RepID=UPI000B987582|nr:glycoside hydrolase family 38 C-terminal domain-containing protein [Paenibacillus sp. XY044]OZB95153.1 alpha-mannosidase [Paenibacillus sp. XY044]